LERFFAEHEFHVEHLLCGSDCETLPIGELLAFEPGASERFGRMRLGYTESQGSPALRREIARIYDSVADAVVLVHAGAEEGIFLFMHAALEPSDHVIVHWPCYQSLFEIASWIGCDVSRWEAREGNGWALDLDELRGLLRPNTRAIVLNVPHNPTGHLMERADYEELHRLAEERGLFLFADEVYRECEYEPSERLTAAADVGSHAVSLGVMSKTYGLAGLRLGWTVTKNASLRARMAELKDYTTICTSGPSEFLSEVALRHRERLVERNLGIIRGNLPLLDEFFARHRDRLSWIRPRAGSIAFPRLLEGRIDEFVDELIRAAGVLLLPGRVFHDDGSHFRIGFGRASLPEALGRLDGFLSTRR